MSIAAPPLAPSEIRGTEQYDNESDLIVAGISSTLFENLDRIVTSISVRIMESGVETATPEFDGFVLELQTMVNDYLRHVCSSVIEGVSHDAQQMIQLSPSSPQLKSLEFTHEASAATHAAYEYVLDMFSYVAFMNNTKFRLRFSDRQLAEFASVRRSVAHLSTGEEQPGIPDVLKEAIGGNIWSLFTSEATLTDSWLNELFHLPPVFAVDVFQKSMSDLSSLMFGGVLARLNASPPTSAESAKNMLTTLICYMAAANIVNVYNIAGIICARRLRFFQLQALATVGYNALRDGRETLFQQKSFYESQIEELNRRLANASNERLQLAGMLESQTQIVRSQQAEIQALQSDLQQRIDAHEAVQSQLDRHVSVLSSHFKDDIQESYDNQSDLLRDLESAVIATVRNLHLSQQNRQTVAEELRGVNAALAVSQNTERNFQAKIVELEKERDVNLAKISTLTAEIEKANVWAAETAVLGQRMLDTKHQLEQQLNSANGEIRKLLDRIAELEPIVSGVSEASERVNSLELANADLNTFKQHYSELQILTEDLKSKIRDLDVEIDGLEEEMTRYRKTVAELNVALENGQRNVADLTVQLTSATSALASMESERNSLLVNLATERGEKSELTSRVELLQSQISQLLSERDSMASQLEQFIVKQEAAHDALSDAAEPDVDPDEPGADAAAVHALAAVSDISNKIRNRGAQSGPGGDEEHRQPLVTPFGSQPQQPFQRASYPISAAAAHQAAAAASHVPQAMTERFIEPTSYGGSMYHTQFGRPMRRGNRD